MTLYLVMLASFFTASISAITGMGGGIALLSVMTFLSYSHLQLVAIHGLIQLVSNSSRMYFLRENVDRVIVRSFLFGLIPSAIIIMFILKELGDLKKLQLLIAAMIFYVLFKPKKMKPLSLEKNKFYLLGFYIGFAGPLIGATGPFLAPFFLRDDMSKKEIISTKAAVQTLGHFIKIPVFLYAGFNYFSHSNELIGFLILTVLGTKFGVYLLKLLSEKQFRQIYKSVLFLAAIRIIYVQLIIPYF